MFDFKRADQKALFKQFNRIAEESGDDRFFTSRELQHLPAALLEGEQVLAFTSGLMQGDTWLIALTDKRVLFLDAGMIYGLKQTEIDLDKVNAVSSDTGWWFGSIRIAHGSGTHTIEDVSKKSVRIFSRKMREAIEARKLYLFPGRPSTVVPMAEPGSGQATLLERTTVVPMAEPGRGQALLEHESNLPATVIEHAQAGRKFDAIKTLRAERGLGMREAMKCVDTYMAAKKLTSTDTEGYGCLGILVLAALALGLYFYFS